MSSGNLRRLLFNKNTNKKNPQKKQRLAVHTCTGEREYSSLLQTGHICSQTNTKFTINSLTIATNLMNCSLSLFKTHKFEIKQYSKIISPTQQTTRVLVWWRRKMSTYTVAESTASIYLHIIHSMINLSPDAMFDQINYQYFSSISFGFVLYK